MNILVARVVKLLCNHKLSSSKGQTSGTHSQHIPQKHVAPQVFLNAHWSIIFVIVNGHVCVVRAESGKVSGTTCLSQEEHTHKNSLEDEQFEDQNQYCLKYLEYLCLRCLVSALSNAGEVHDRYRQRNGVPEWQKFHS